MSLRIDVIVSDTIDGDRRTITRSIGRHSPVRRNASGAIVASGIGLELETVARDLGVVVHAWRWHYGPGEVINAGAVYGGLRAPEKAVQRGHELKPDPPFFSSALRWTCEKCGAAAIRLGANTYGTATTNNCRGEDDE